MCHFEEKWVINSSDCPNVWFRYVDDTFTLFQNKDTAIKFLYCLNSRHENIQFTIEFESNQQIPFLDVSIKRLDITTPSQHPFTARKLSLDFILNGTHSHPESTRYWTSSEYSLIAVSASVPRPLCWSLPLTILRIFCHATATPWAGLFESRLTLTQG